MASRPAKKPTPAKKPAKAPAKKAAARKTPARKRAPRIVARPAGKPGPAPLVLRGFTYTPGDDTTTGAAQWAAKSPAAELLAALAIGATWEHAADYAHLHEATGRTWNDRGETALGEHPDLDHLHAADVDLEALAYAAFHLAAAEARGAPVMGSLQTIDRARRGGDWKAAVAQLKHLPQARPYLEVQRHEHTGPDGGAVPIDVRAQGVLEALQAFQQEPPTPDEV